MSDWLIVYTLEGEGYFRTPSGEQRCGAGNVGLLRSGVPHQYGTSQGQRWHFVWAHFPRLPEPGFRFEEEVTVRRVSDAHTRRRIYRALRNVLQDSRERAGLWHPLCENSLREVLLLIADNRRQPLDPRVEYVLHFLSQRMKETIKIDQIANAVRLSPSRLSHLFKEQTGESIVERLNRIRIDQAALLLGNTDRTAGEAALDVGFQNYNHFACLFRKQTGLSPRGYRNKVFTDPAGQHS